MPTIETCKTKEKCQVSSLSAAHLVRSPIHKIMRIERVDAEGKRTFEPKDPPIEVADLEKFRKVLKGRKYVDVFFVYETVDDVKKKK